MGTQVHARFHVQSLERVPHFGAAVRGAKHEEALRVKLGATTGEPFGPATPQGSIDMLIVNPAAAAVFHGAKVGQEFDLVFTRRDEEK